MIGGRTPPITSGQWRFVNTGKSCQPPRNICRISGVNHSVEQYRSHFVKLISYGWGVWDPLTRIDSDDGRVMNHVGVFVPAFRFPLFPGEAGIEPVWCCTSTSWMFILFGYIIAMMGIQVPQVQPKCILFFTSEDPNRFNITCQLSYCQWLLLVLRQGSMHPEQIAPILSPWIIVRPYGLIAIHPGSEADHSVELLRK